MPEYKATLLRREEHVLQSPNDEGAHTYFQDFAGKNGMTLLKIVRVGKNEDEKCQLCEEQKAKQDQIVELSPLIEEQRK